jgi:protein-tyrosine phosphatase
MGDMDLISNIIKAQINSGENVLIHCRAGKGRSVLGVLAYLMNACGKTAEEAEKQIKSHRKQATIDKEKGRKAQADYQAHLFRQQYKIRSTNADMFVAQGDNTER